MDEVDTIYDIPVKDIRVSDLNVRTSDLKEGIEELAESVEKYGLLQPVVIRGEYGKPPYELIIGQRRLSAHKYLKKKTKTEMRPSSKR